MTGKYQAYPEYKDSDVEWLNEIPSGWKVLRYKNILKIMQGMAFKSTEYVDSSSVVNIRMGNIKKGGHLDLEHNTKYLPEKYKDLYSDYQLNKGDAIIAMTDMSPSLEFLAVPAILEGLDEHVTYLLNQRVGKLILNKEFDIRFVRYWLLSDELRSQLKAKGLGTVQANMSNDDLYDAYFFCSPESERLKIVEFLDHETAKIDTLIEKQQQLIELLKEKRQAVISHAVTKGLNPNAPMRDSGVEWLGEVPEHWSVTRVGFYAKKIGSGKTPRGGSEIYQDEGVLFLRSQNVYDEGLRVSAKESVYISNAIHEEMSNTKVFPGDVLLNITGASIGRSCLVPAGFPEANVNQHVCIIRLPSNLNEFLSYAFKSKLIKTQIAYSQTGGNREGLNFEHISKLIVCTPPVKERKEIVSFIQASIAKYNDIEQKAKAAIALMQERRTALISAAVTGKIDVRHWQALEAVESKEAI